MGSKIETIASAVDYFGAKNTTKEATGILIETIASAVDCFGAKKATKEATGD